MKGDIFTEGPNQLNQRESFQTRQDGGAEKMDNHHQRDRGPQRMRSAKHEEQQILKASETDETLTERLMERICTPLNLNRAYKRVKANKGAAGVDGMTVDELLEWIAIHKDSLREYISKRLSASSSTTTKN